MISSDISNSSFSLPSNFLFVFHCTSYSFTHTSFSLLHFLISFYYPVSHSRRYHPFSFLLFPSNLLLASSSSSLENLFQFFTLSFFPIYSGLFALPVLHFPSLIFSKFLFLDSIASLFIRFSPLPYPSHLPFIRYSLYSILDPLLFNFLLFIQSLCIICLLVSAFYLIFLVSFPSLLPFL